MTEDVIDQIREAIGAEEGETITVQTPTFERQDGKEPEDPPLTESAWESLRNLSVEELTDLGFQNWDGDLYLLPAEWYPHIPEGVEFTSIMGRKVEFEPGETDNDRRFGALSYGLVVGMDADEYREREQTENPYLETDVAEKMEVEENGD